MSLREQARAAVERHQHNNQTPAPKKPRFVVTNPRNVQPVAYPGYPGHDTRIHAEPGSFGAGFAAAGIGRYLED